MADQFVERVAEILHRYSMLPPSGRVGVAVSGGADSVVLLHLLHRLRDRFACELAVLHANHGLRGAESDGDEAFVRDLARSLGYECRAEAAPPGEGNLEQAARDARRAFFARARNEAKLDRIALGHTRSDQAETVLYRFLRGSGSAGLSGMRPITRDGLVRPLLTVSRDEVRAWAQSQGISWREDSSNQDTRFARNILRNEAIPALARNFNPNLEGVLARTALVAQAEEEYWEDLVAATYPKLMERSQLGSFFQVDGLNALHPSLRRRVLRRAVAEVRGDLRGIDVQHIEAVMAVAAGTEGHDRVIIPGVDALRSYSTLLLTIPGKLNEAKRHFRLEIAFGSASDLPFGLGKIELFPTANKLQNCANVGIDQTPSTEIAYLDSDALRGPLYVRNWEPGDGLRRPGHSSFEKLKTLFQEHRILLWERRHWPVLICGDEVIWTRRFGPSAEVAAGDTARQVMCLRYSA